jgi:[acyl-carrier-protein] S-malonyltransferase
VFDGATALSLAAERAACMDAAGAVAETGLLAVSGGDPRVLTELCERFELDVAIRIDPGSVVLGGLRSRLAQAGDTAAERGLRCTPLNVALASHTRWMKPAASAFAHVLARTPLQRPALPLTSNALGLVRDAARAGDALSRQIAQTVAWDDCMATIESRHVCAVLEIGPGQALARMWWDRHPEVPARSVDEFHSAAAVIDWLSKRLAQG